MSTSTASSKGQVTIPIEIRRRLGIEPGSVVRFVDNDGVIVLEKVDASLGTLCGLVTARRTLTLAEMDEIPAQVALERHARD